jgi:hypothetical protein
MNKYFCRVVIFIFALMPASLLAIEYSWNGFATVTAANIIAAEKNNPAYLDLDCPCFISDYNTGGIYEQNGWDITQETRLGLQGMAQLTDDLQAVGQVMGRTGTGKMTLEWAYLSYALNPNWTLQAGRKRIPLYYYSDFQDVGQAYIWARPPQALYGWEASNYNGASIRYKNRIARWAVSASAFTGNEEVKDSGYASLYDTTDQDAKWENITGFDIEVSKDWLTTRFVYMQSDNYVTGHPLAGYADDPVKQKVMGLAINMDFDDWFILSEFNLNKRESSADDYKISAPATLLAYGMRLGNYTPFLSYSRYWDNSNNYAAYEPERFEDWSATLRYDINTSSDIKVQYDYYLDKSVADFVGDTQVITLSYDIVF